MRGPKILILLAAVTTFAEVTVAAQQPIYPNRPIRFIVPFAAGGTTDIIARLMGEKLGEEFGQHLIVDNRGGAGSTIGTAIAAAAAPDGYTILLGNNGLAINETLYPKLPYAALKNLTPISLVGSTPNVLVVNNALPAKSVKEFIALAKVQPGKLAYASAGVGSSTHLSVELLQSVAGVNFTHVPYKGGAPALNDTISGQVQFMLATMPSAHSHIKVGRLRALGVSGTKRSPALPAIPTIAESGISGYTYTSWYGILAPTGTPQAVLSHLNRATNEVLRIQSLREKLSQQGLEPEPTTSEKFRDLIQTEIGQWRKIIKSAGIRIE